MNERYFEKLKRQVKKMDEDQLKGYLEQGLLFEKFGFTAWARANEILREELELRMNLKQSLTKS